MPNKVRFPYIASEPMLSETSLRPILPIKLAHEGRSLDAMGLLDTGATVNVMPFSVGLRLGAEWDALTVSVQLTGNLSQLEARGLLVQASVAEFPPVRLAFAWTRADNVPLLLGQVNFFMEFDVCFYRSDGVFDLIPAHSRE